MNNESIVFFGFIIGITWLVTALFDYLYYTAIWQLKEYRIDRFKDFSKTKQGRDFFKDFRYISRGLGAILLWIQPLAFIGLVVLILDVVYTIFVLRKKFRRPIFTSKALLILFFSLGIETFVFFLFPQNLPFVLFLRFCIISLVVVGFGIPSTLAKQYYIKKARKKMERYPNLVVIGITGSYGKSSVKEFTAHILSTQYKVIKTPNNINSEIGVARFILATDFSGVKIFVCEMGAYKKGEIKLICDMVKPRIGILTTIADQHLSLFGSVRNIQSAKYELLRSIPKEGLILTNADNPYCTEFLKTLECQNIETCGMEEEKDPTCKITRIKTNLRGIEFDAYYCGKKGKITAPVVSAHNAFNICLSLMVAVNMGIDPNNIIQAISHLPKDVQGVLKVYSYGKSTILDDSYNSNPAGFQSALDVLSLYPSQKKRIVITRGMLELAEHSDEEHEKIGGAIAFGSDELVVITPDFFEPLKRGVGEKYHTKVRTLFQSDELLSYVKRCFTKDCVILLENRIPSKVYKELQKDRT